jgi:hypothetical protein
MTKDYFINNYPYTYNNNVICIKNVNYSSKKSVYLDLNNIKHQTIITKDLNVILTGRLDKNSQLNLFVDK